MSPRHTSGPIRGPETFRRVPWRNGNGTTLELATDRPPGDSDWSWRLSLADVPTAGPFSVFPGVDRLLACLDGAGLIVRGVPVAGGTDPTETFPRVEVPRRGPALAFPGEATVSGEPVGPGVRDANLMVRRGVFTGALHVLRGDLLMAEGERVLVYSHGAGEVSVAMHSGGVAVVVPSGHLGCFDGPCTVVCPEGMVAVVAAMRACPAS